MADLKEIFKSIILLIYFFKLFHLKVLVKEKQQWNIFKEASDLYVVTRMLFNVRTTI